MIKHEDILFRDDHFIAVNKPCGLLVHRSPTDSEDTDFALQQVRDLIGKRVYPFHRLDKPTSGVLMFGLNPQAASEMSKIFLKREVDKTYVALVRGWMQGLFISLNYPVKDSKEKLVEARTDFCLLDKFELNIPVPPFQTTRYSIVEAHPKTGRWHQIRQHLAHLRNYIINDRVHGTGHYNRMFTEQLNLSELFLHAKILDFIHPYTHEKIKIEASLPEHWVKLNEVRKQFEIEVLTD